MRTDAILRNLPDFKGKRRLARLFYGGYLRKAKDILITGSYGCKYLLPNLVEIISFELFINGIYEEASHTFLLEKLPPDAIFIDLGANIGTITIPICKKRSDVRAICVEASPWVFAYLEKNIRLNELSNIELVHKAIFDSDGVEIDFFGPTDEFGKGSMTAHYTDKSVKVPTVMLDTLLLDKNLPRVDLIKIDIQGFEYFAFKGASRLLGAANAPDILFEFEDWAEGTAADLQAGNAQTVLMAYGYDLYLLTGRGAPVRQTEPLLKGSHMLYATKKDMLQWKR